MTSSSHVIERLVLVLVCNSLVHLNVLWRCPLRLGHVHLGHRDADHQLHARANTHTHTQVCDSVLVQRALLPVNLLRTTNKCISQQKSVDNDAVKCRGCKNIRRARETESRSNTVMSCHVRGNSHNAHWYLSVAFAVLCSRVSCDCVTLLVSQCPSISISRFHWQQKAQQTRRMC